MRRFIGKKQLGVVLVGSLAFAGLSFAHPGALKRFDTNGDGQLDATEREAMREAKKARRAERRQEMLAKFDANKDGQLDDAERTAARNAKTAEIFKQLDTDGNAVLTLEEFQAGAGKFGRHGRHGRR